MPRTDLNGLHAFRTVAEERSLTRPAAQPGVSPSALSRILRGLEARLGLPLLTRTTRSVALTETGERLLGNLDAPSYFSRHPRPRRPQDLTEHSCINLRQQTSGGLYAWELEKGRHELRVRVGGQLVFNVTPMILKAALAGFSLACLFEDQVQAHLADGRLVRVLADLGGEAAAALAAQFRPYLQEPPPSMVDQSGSCRLGLHVITLVSSHDMEIVCL